MSVYDDEDVDFVGVLCVLLLFCCYSMLSYLYCYCCIMFMLCLLFCYVMFVLRLLYSFCTCC